MTNNRRVRRIIKVRVGDTFDGTLIRMLSQTKEPQIGGFGWDEFMYIEVEQDEPRKAALPDPTDEEEMAS